MDQNQFQAWLAGILSGKDIKAVRVRLSKADKSVGNALDKLKQAQQIVSESSSTEEVRTKARKAGLLPENP